MLGNHRSVIEDIESKNAFIPFPDRIITRIKTVPIAVAFIIISARISDFGVGGQLVVRNVFIGIIGRARRSGIVRIILVIDVAAHLEAEVFF